MRRECAQPFALNADTHGLTAQTVVLETESPDGYEIELQNHFKHFLPPSKPETDLVKQLAAAWRLTRYPGVESGLPVSPASNSGLRLLNLTKPPPRISRNSKVFTPNAGDAPVGRSEIEFLKHAGSDSAPEEREPETRNEKPETSSTAA